MGQAVVRAPCPSTCYSPCSLPDHPISQLLKKLQCAVYSALYPAVSRGALSTASAPGADALLAPGGRRLRSSQSLYCMLSPPESSVAPRPQDGLPATPTMPPLNPGPLDRGADSSPAGLPSPLTDASACLPDKDSSFEDLEQFLAMSERWSQGPGGQPEPQTPGTKREPLLECLKSTVKDIHDAIDRLLSLTLLAFENLNTATCKDRCLACIEEPFFSPLWPLLLALYRSVHCTQEAALSRSMELYRNVPPTALGIPTRLLPPHSETRGATTYPYCAAVQELGLLVLESCPQKKLEHIGTGGFERWESRGRFPPHGLVLCWRLWATDILWPNVRAAPRRHGTSSSQPCTSGEGGRQQDAHVGTRGPPIPAGSFCCTPPLKPGFCAAVRTLRAICVCAEEYCRAQEATHQASAHPPAAAIGADDLLPILSFVVLRSGLPQLVSECAALEEFTHEGYLIGEEGYCLTSLQSALSYVQLLPRGVQGH
ncbi:Hypothetical predicted protein [Marmota monax]|uniref:VPS9 domain-containing protein n=1 Tax=Marmota monax TaxID=9995 RepID=A0A5E4BII1_MARMO|nr:Hypothetical predicted protein [Marmota monax]